MKRVWEATKQVLKKLYKNEISETTCGTRVDSNTWDLFGELEGVVGPVSPSYN